MKKIALIFPCFLFLGVFCFPNNALGLIMNVNLSIDSITIPARGINVSLDTSHPGRIVPSTDLEMGLHAGCGVYPRVVVIQSPTNQSSGDAKFVSGGHDASYKANNIIAGQNLAFKAGDSTTSPISSGDLLNVDFTKSADFSFTYTATSNPTFSLYLEICAACNTTPNYYCNADCTAVATVPTGGTNCAITPVFVNNVSQWVNADCSIYGCSSSGKFLTFLGGTESGNTNSSNYFYIFLEQLYP